MPPQAERLAMSPEVWEDFRRLYFSDPWEFGLDICGADKLVERFHRPLIYLYACETKLLIEVLKSPLRSLVITKIKQAFQKRGLDYKRAAHLWAINEFIHKQNIRVARKLGKSTCRAIAILFRVTRNPNEAHAYITRDDDQAHKQGEWMVRIIKSDVYRFFFPERIPVDERANLSQSWILLGGRTINIPEPCVQLGGYSSGWVGGHYSALNRDDMTGLENRSPNRLQGVRDFESHRRGLMMPEWDGPIIDSSTGTRWAKQDDAAALDADPDCLTIYVPIEEFQGRRTFKNMLLPGVPVLPEWFDKEQIAKEKREYMKDQEGPTALLANLHLTILAEASAVFSPELVDEKVWTKYELEKGFQLSRPGSVKKYDPHDLEIMAGGDPSASRTGDNWGVSIAGREPYGTRFQLKTIRGRGAAGFLDALLHLDEQWNPQKIGIEKAAMQEWVLLAISKDERFQRIVHKFVGVPVNNLSKRTRAINLLAAPMEMGELYRDPEDREGAAEMKNWDPDNPKQSPGGIDSLGICMTLFDTPAHGHTDKEITAMATKEREETRFDDFGLPIENVLSDDDYGFTLFGDDFDLTEMVQ